jgi:hypothetical protein
MLLTGTLLPVTVPSIRLFRGLALRPLVSLHLQGFGSPQVILTPWILAFR